RCAFERRYGHRGENPESPKGRHARPDVDPDQPPRFNGEVCRPDYCSERWRDRGTRHSRRTDWPGWLLRGFISEAVARGGTYRELIGNPVRAHCRFPRSWSMPSFRPSAARAGIQPSLPGSTYAPSQSDWIPAPAYYPPG